MDILYLGKWARHHLGAWLFALPWNPLIRLRSVPIEALRCQELPFSEQLGFSGKPIHYFPPYGFYAMALTDPQKARSAFAEWLRMCLIDLEAWKIPQREGGWQNGSLVRTVYAVHREHGRVITSLEQAEPAWIDEAIARRVAYYFELFDSIRENGFKKNQYPPIYCRARRDLFYLDNGHHRVSVLAVLDYSTVVVRVL